MYELLKGSQGGLSQEVKPTKVTNKYVENFERLLCAGAYKQLKERKDKGITEGIISKFSPNNVRRVVLGLDGVYVQFYVSPVNFKAKEQFVPITFTEQLGAELSAESKSTPITKVLRGDSRSLFGSRVFSSIEEIIVLSSSPEVQGYLLDNHGLDWFLDPSRKQTVESSFKRLRAVGLVEDSVTCKEFVESHRAQINDPYGLILRDTELNYVGALFNDDLYYTHTALRPQYYEMDEEGGALWNYFQEVKKGSPKTSNKLDVQAEEDSFLADNDLTLVTNFLGLVRVLEGYQSEISAQFPTLKETLEVGEHNKALAKEYVNSMVAFVKEHRDITSYPTPKISITSDTTYLRAVSVANYLLKNKDNVGLSKGVDSIFIGYLTALTTCLELVLEGISFDFMDEEFVSSYKSGLELYFSDLSDETAETEEDNSTVEEETTEGLTEEVENSENYQGLYDKLVSFGFNLEGVEFKPLVREITLEGVDFLPDSVLARVGEVSPLFAVISDLTLENLGSYSDFFSEEEFFCLACSLKDLDLSDEEVIKLASFGIFGLESDGSVFEGYTEFVEKHSKLKEQFGELDSYFANEGKGSEFKQIRPSFKEFAERFADDISVELLAAPNYLAVDVLGSAYGKVAWGVTLPKVSQLPKLNKLLTDLVTTTRVSYRFRRDFEKFEREFGVDTSSYLSSKHLTKEGDYLSDVIDTRSFVKIMSEIFSYNPPSEVRDISGVFQKALELVEKKEGEVSE